MYLSQLLLDLRSNSVRADLADVHKMHQRVLSAFPDAQLQEARRSYGVLYRLDHREQGPPKLLVQSSTLPDWNRLPPSYFVDSDASQQIVSLDSFLSQIVPGSIVRLRLRANTTKRLRTGSSTPGKRIGLKTDEEKLGWFARHAGGAGLAPIRDNDGASSPWADAVRVSSEPPARGRRQDAPVTLAASVFDGFGIVEDCELLMNAIRTGVGPAKSYGFGLLSVAPVVHP